MSCPAPNHPSGFMEFHPRLHSSLPVELPRILSVAQVVRAVVPYSGAATVVLWLCCNAEGGEGQGAAAFCDALLTLAESSAQQHAALRPAALRLVAAVCRLDPQVAAGLRRRLVRERRQPELVLQLTRAPCDDMVVFLSSVLTDRKGCDFLLVHIAKHVSGSVSGSVRHMQRTVLQAISATHGGDGSQTAVAVRVATLLFSQTNLTLAPAEVQGLLQALSMPREGPQAGRVAQLGLCLLLSCQAFTMHCEEDEVRLLLERLAQQLTAHGHADWMLLLASHFHQQALAAVAQLFRTTVETTFQVSFPRSRSPSNPPLSLSPPGRSASPPVLGIFCVLGQCGHRPQNRLPLLLVALHTQCPPHFCP